MRSRQISKESDYSNSNMTNNLTNQQFKVQDKNLAESHENGKEKGFFNTFMGCFAFSNNCNDTEGKALGNPLNNTSHNLAKPKNLLMENNGGLLSNKTVNQNNYNSHGVYSQSTNQLDIETKVVGLENKVKVLEDELDKKRKDNQKLSQELLELEKNKNISKSGSLFLEKDELRSEVQRLTKELTERGEKLRHLTATHKML